MVVGLHIDNDNTETTLVHTYTDNTRTHTMVVGLHIDNDGIHTARVHT